MDFAELFETHREHLWGLCYRVTGSAADAEDLVQETFARVIERPPPDLDRSLRPWLTRVATNLAIDALRRRKQRDYVGPWLPTPIASTPEMASPQPDVEARYGLVESATAAFLYAVEVLPPVQRAALILRDAIGYTGPETAAILETTPDNVRMMVHRARRALAGYDEERCRPGPEADAASTAAMQRLFAAVAQGDLAAIRACLTENAIAVTDGGGKIRAATKEVRGPDRVSTLLESLGRRGGSRVIDSVPMHLNGLPALLVLLHPAEERDATKMVVQLQADRRGLIRRVFVWTAPEKI
jgi:RNA polymerase sigma-70 factor (ECF subfamily)